MAIIWRISHVEVCTKKYNPVIQSPDFFFFLFHNIRIFYFYFYFYFSVSDFISQFSISSAFMISITGANLVIYQYINILLYQYTVISIYKYTNMINMINMFNILIYHLHLRQNKIAGLYPAILSEDFFSIQFSFDFLMKTFK